MSYIPAAVPVSFVQPLFMVTWTFWVIKWVEKIKGGHFG